MRHPRRAFNDLLDQDQDLIDIVSDALRDLVNVYDCLLDRLCGLGVFCPKQSEAIKRSRDLAVPMALWRGLTPV